MYLKISQNSNSGQGIAFDQDNNKIFVDNAILGDEIEAKIIKKNSKFTLAKIIKIINPSKIRQEPPCIYFKNCGGCNLQHFSNKFYQEFKLNNLQNALNRQQIKYPQIDFIEIGQNSRRRITLQIDHNNKLGFFQENSHNLIAISDCLMAVSEIRDIIPKLQNLLNKLSRKLIKSINICQFDNIIEVIFNLQKSEIDINDNEMLIDFANIAKNINLYQGYQGKITPIYEISKAYINFGNLKIYPDNDIFLQATKKGQNAIISIIKDFIISNKIDNIIDLYCGIATYSFSIIDNIKDSICFEGLEKMVDIVNINAKKNNLSHKIAAKSRDLARNPLKNTEFENIDLVLINPPRSGARKQIEEIASSSIKNIIVISCDMKSFCQDAKILVENGFNIDKITIIDQFYYTSHIEIVTIFKK